jgi:hypothetical protein
MEPNVVALMVAGAVDHLVVTSIYLITRQLLVLVSLIVDPM